MKILSESGPAEINLNFAQKVKKRSGQALELCYQCRKCAAGCPMGEYGDYHPNQILRMVQYGLKDRVLRTSSIWVCSGCETCGARCPNDIKISEIMDVLREMAIEENVPAAKKNIPIFHNVFLDFVKSNGRVQETFMMLWYKLKSGDFFSDIDVGLKMFQKGKLPLMPSGIKNKEAVRGIFDKVKKSK